MPPAETRPPHSSVAERYRVLLDIGRTITGTLSHADLYRAIFRETARVLEAPGFYISHYDPERDLATIVFYADRGAEQQVEIGYRGNDSEVIRTGRSVLVADREQVRSALLLGKGEGDVTRSAISAPLIHKGQVLGAISAQSYRARAYTHDDLELLQGIADVATIALENARFVAQLERQRKEAEQIEEIGRALSSSLDGSEVLQKVIGAVLAVVPVDGVAVWLTEGNAIARLAAAGGTLAPPPEREWDLGGALAQRLFVERRPFGIADLQASPSVPTGLRGGSAAGSAIALPLVVGDAVPGVLSASSTRPGFFGEDETRVLLRLASQASVALENARLHARVQALSLTDPLTGLPNRRQLGIHLEREVAAARRGRPLVVCVHDLDFFKEYNDSAGHMAGDDALRAFGELLTDENRAMNLVARYGGDEFVSVLSESTLEGGLVYMQRVETRIEQDPILGPSGIRVTTGLAVFDRVTMTTAADVIQAADTDLYRKKGERRR